MSFDRHPRRTLSLTECWQHQESGFLVTNATSNARVLDWEQRWAPIVQKVPADAAAARDRLSNAQQHVHRAKRDLGDNDADAAVIMAEFALVNTTDAILLRDGYRLRGQTGSHQARFEYPLLPAIFAANRQLLTRARFLRNAAAYEAGGRIGVTQAKEIVDLAERAVAAVDAILPQPSARGRSG